ncbi:MAG TPA: right-handed parallel beta-helix repeat-containing protein [Thermoplasmata archaeon]
MLWPKTRTVRIVAVGVLIALSTFVLTIVPPATAAASCGPAPRGPILIKQDSDFTPANGVVSGSGTAADPFLIAKLQLKDLSPGYGLKVDNSKGKVTKFFNIDCVQSNWTTAPPKGAVLVWIVNVHTQTTISQVDANSGEAGGSVGIRIDGSSFIVLEDESINKFGSDGVRVSGSDHITVIESKLKAMGNGLSVMDSHDVTIGKPCTLRTGSGCNEFTYDGARGIFVHDSYNVLVVYTITSADDTGGVLLDGSGTYNVTLLNGKATADGPICEGGVPTGEVSDTISGIAVTNGAHDIAVHGYTINANGNGFGGFFDIMNGGNGGWLNSCTGESTTFRSTPPGGANLDFSGNCYHFEFGFDPAPPSSC